MLLPTKKMFDLLRTIKSPAIVSPPTPVGCFGKLPIYDDFIRHNVSTRSAMMLDEWVQQGYSHYGRLSANKRKQDEAPSSVYKFLFSGVDENCMPTIGTIMGSRDKCGREFPFVIYKIIGDVNSRDLIPAIPCAYDQFFKKAESISTSGWSSQPMSILKLDIDALSEEPPGITRRRLVECEIAILKSTKKDIFWQNTLSLETVSGVPRLIESVKDLLDGAMNKSTMKTPWGLAIPISEDKHTMTHVTFWVQAAEEILGKNGWHPHFIWGFSQYFGRVMLYLFFRPIPPSFFSHLMDNSLDPVVLIDVQKHMPNIKTPVETAISIGTPSGTMHMGDAINEWTQWVSMP